jgi:ribosomal protein S18 acetylase RimI-like enzyme
LWVFEPNQGAIRFYERNGFVTVRKTDGRDNEEKVPDRLMAWQRAHVAQM